MRRLAIFVLLALTGLAPLAWSQLNVSVASKFSFVAYGDIRFTDSANTQVSNPPVRRSLVTRIAAQKPAFVLISGDLVLTGGNPEDWKVWRAETEPLRAAGIPVFPVLGNHELRGDPQATNYFAQFPELQNRRWYTVRAGNVLCYMLDSESNIPGGEQWQWLERQLAQVPAEVDFLLVMLHHPPYTNSRDKAHGGGHAARPAEAKLAALLEQRQSAMRQPMLVISGHVHNYERYQHNGVMYVVSGGGGATPYEVSRSDQDLFREPGPNYHFLRIDVDGNKMSVKMEKLRTASELEPWAVKDSFLLQSPVRTKAARAH
jgi:Icc-related predicted phosphoesterase